MTYSRLRPVNRVVHQLKERGMVLNLGTGFQLHSSDDAGGIHEPFLQSTMGGVALAGRRSYNSADFLTLWQSWRTGVSFLAYRVYNFS